MTLQRNSGTGALLTTSLHLWFPKALTEENGVSSAKKCNFDVRAALHLKALKSFYL